ncbi:MAG: PDZ domain-containing protein [Oscillospiraceae bacterium]|nr:PDZ domain-containing protein [Oscillospiraceae bacterium]MBQ3999575.1 PDZ domain-containing protein [Oscillospiraceae bacterium]
MNKKITVGITLAFIFIAIALTFTATMIYSMNLFDQKIVSIQERESLYDKISQIDSFVRQNYYRNVDDGKILDGLARGYISGTGDAEIKYFTNQEYTRILETKGGKLCGIGVEHEVNGSGFVQITEVHPSTSAEKIGMEAGDTIVMVNDEDALELGAEKVAEALYGSEGDEVTLTYSREGMDYTFTFVYGQYETRSIVSYEVEGYAYFRFMSFTLLTGDQFQEELAERLSSGTIKGLILDLRNTDGGYDLNVVAKIMDRLIGQSTMISGIYNGGYTKVLYTSDRDSVEMPVAVLINGGTKGYSELFAAAMGECNNVRLVGEQTYGSGTYGVFDQFTDGTALYVPVCELLAFGTVRYNEIGVTPDFVTASFDDFVIPDGEPSILQDLQLRKAVEVLDSEF